MSRMPHRVSASDVAFLSEETSRSPLHATTVAILQPGEAGFDYSTLVDPLFVAGAQMVQTYPAPPLTEGHVLAIGATSYDGGIYLGLVGDRDALPDLEVLGTCLRAPRGRKPPETP